MVPGLLTVRESPEGHLSYLHVSVLIVTVGLAGLLAGGFFSFALATMTIASLALIDYKEN